MLLCYFLLVRSVLLQFLVPFHLHFSLCLFLLWTTCVSVRNYDSKLHQILTCWRLAGNYETYEPYDMLPKNALYITCPKEERKSCVVIRFLHIGTLSSLKSTEPGRLYGELSRFSPGCVIS
ncbi:hypothetical protein Mapa_010348 [Marchantia paleacea]|nr:hypothetical protein Mapa_010348 [Marchantia paleacea]